MFFSADKIRAFAIHLAISATIVGIVFFLIFFYWYPKPFFEANGAWTVLRILVGVDLVMGPLLTLVLFKKGKKGLVLDMCMIAAVQLTALVYGVNVIYGERPYYLVYAVDRFEVVGRVEIDETKIKYPQLKEKPNDGPILVFADFPEDKEERDNFLFEVVTEGKPDLERRPEYYKLYTPNIDKVLQNGKDLNELVKANRDNMKEVEKISRNYPNKNLVFFPLVGKNNDMALVVDKATGLPIDGISVDPWIKNNN